MQQAGDECGNVLYPTEASVRLCFFMSESALCPGGERMMWNIAPACIGSDPDPDPTVEVMATCSASCCLCKHNHPTRGLTVSVPMFITSPNSRRTHIISHFPPSQSGGAPGPANTTLFIFTAPSPSLPKHIPLSRASPPFSGLILVGYPTPPLTSARTSTADSTCVPGATGTPCTTARSHESRCAVGRRTNEFDTWSSGWGRREERRGRNSR